MANTPKKYINIGDILKRRYLLAFSLIAFLVILSQVIIQIMINGQESDSRVINIAGRQRMLSQRINKAAFGLYLAEDEDSRIAYLDELSSSINLWKQSHIGLQNGDKSLGLPNKNSTIIKQLFSNIDESHQNILKAGYDIISIVKKGPYSKEDLYPIIEQIKKNETIFLKQMDTIVFQYDYEFKKKVDFIKYTELSLLFVTLLLLLLELIFIFRPAKNEVNRVFCQLQESHENILNLFETAPNPMFLIDEESLNIIQFNKFAEELMDINCSNCINLKLDDILKNNSVKNNIIDKIKNNKKISNEEAILHTPSNKNLITLISSRKIKFYDKSTILLGLSDITKLKQAEKILRRYATVDEMTDLLNKRSGLLLLDNLFQKAKSDGSDISITFIDIDELKAVNDTYGHDEGDWYIKTVSKTLLSNMRSGDCVFRYGGDEIILVFANCDYLKANSILKRIEKKLSIIRKEYNKPYKLSISYGTVDTSLVNTDNTYELIKAADRSMYKNKQRKKH